MQIWEQVSEGDSIDEDGENQEKQQAESKKMVQDEEESDDIMVKVKPDQLTFKDDEDDAAPEEFKVNMKQAIKKAKHLKIKSDGMFQGKNR